MAAFAQNRNEKLGSPFPKASSHFIAPFLLFLESDSTPASYLVPEWPPVRLSPLQGTGTSFPLSQFLYCNFLPLFRIPFFRTFLPAVVFLVTLPGPTTSSRSPPPVPDQVYEMEVGGAFFPHTALYFPNLGPIRFMLRDCPFFGILSCLIFFSGRGRQPPPPFCAVARGTVSFTSVR